MLKYIYGDEMKKILILLILLILTGCESSNKMDCTSINKDTLHTDTYNLSVTFNNNVIKNMSLEGTSIYTKQSLTVSAYNIIKDGYDKVQSLDKNIKTEVHYKNTNLSFSLELDTSNINSEGLKYLQSIFNINKGYPNRQDFMNYINKNNYKCN